MRCLALLSVGLAACTPTYTATFSVPARELTAPEASCVTTSGACVRVIVHDEMTSSFATDSKAITIDGAPIGEGAFVPLPPGHHVAIVDLKMHLVSMCIYCYMRVYAFHLRSRQDFDVGKKATVTLHAIAYEKGGVTTPIEERPAMRWVTR